MRNSAPLGPYSRNMPGPCGGPTGGGRFLMSEVPLQSPDAHILCFAEPLPPVDARMSAVSVQGYLTYQKNDPPTTLS